MRLVGNYFSPFVRRVAISLHTLDLSFQLEEVSVANEPERVRLHNPLVRIPALILDSGDVLVESYAILDEVDQMAGPGRALVPTSGPARRNVMQLMAIAAACVEKAQWAFYETKFRPTQKVHQPWIDHNDGQVVGGLRYLETKAAALAPGAWLAGTSRITQADITTAVVFGSISSVRPNLSVHSEFPALARFAARCEELAAFKAAPAAASPPSAKR